MDKVIYVVDDDAMVRNALTIALTNAGYGVVGFADGAAFMAVARSRFPACVLLDVFIAGSSGIDLLQSLDAPSYPAPVLVMSGRGSIALAVDAISRGAYDFLEKPFSGRHLVDRIELARQRFASRNHETSTTHAMHEPLTSREQEVLSQWVAGGTSKEIARRLEISPRTVEIHRSKIMKKFGAKNSAQIVQIALSEQAPHTA